MNVKKFNISLDSGSGKICFDLEVDSIMCHGSVDIRKSEDLTDLLYAIEEGCQKIRRKLGVRCAEGESLHHFGENPKPRQARFEDPGRVVPLPLGKGGNTVPLVPGHVYVNRGGGEFRCERITVTGTYFVNVKSGWHFKAVGVVMYDDGTIEWDYSTDGRFVRRDSM